MEADLRPPRRRLRLREQYEAPLPVERLSVEEEQLIRAELIHQHVLVCDPEHIRRIHSQGFFGKGILSRSRPEHSVTHQWEQHGGVAVPVMSQSRYQQLLRWAGPAFSAQGLDNQTSFEPIENKVTEEGARSTVGGACPEKRGEEPVPALVLVLSEKEAEPAVLMNAPPPLTEYLQLTLEETFFLVYGLGCLSVHQQQEPLSILQLWRKFSRTGSDFVSSYAAYHHLRSRGWVPKGGGAKYGADFMLYRKGPPFYHASYSVVVRRADGAFRDSSERRFSWRSLAALSRITASVSKELMLCYIIYPDDLSEAELESPDCLRRLSVQEVVVNRWVSSKEREEQDEL